MNQKLTISMVLRKFIMLTVRSLEPGTIERGNDEPNVIRGDLIQRHISIEVPDLSLSLDDVGEAMLPHAEGMAALLRMGRAWQSFDLQLPTERDDVCACSRHTFDGLSMRCLWLKQTTPPEPAEILRFDVLFRPREHSDLPIFKAAKVA